MKIKSLIYLTSIWILSATFAIILTLSTPSDAENAFLFGFSKPRLLMAGFLVVLLGLLITIFFHFHKSQPNLEDKISALNHWLSEGDHLVSILLSGLVLFLLNSGTFLFTWLVFPASTRPIFGLGLVFISTLILFLVIDNLTILRLKGIPGYLKFLPKLNQLPPKQKNTLFILLGIGLIYFLLFVPANLRNTQSLEHFYYHSGDEGVIYPILMEMFVPESNFSSQLYRLFIYEDYHYGYPFYVFSFLVVLPVRLIYGSGFAEQVHINMLLLRQVVSVLPMILSALILVFLMTRYQKRYYSIALFVFILSIPGIVKYNILFWHPDSLAILFVVLTLYFLDRDQFNFGPNWIAAAITCGIASSIRLIGFFSGLAVAYLLIYALFVRKIPFKKLFYAALVFLVVMGAVILLTSPYLLLSSARERFAQILADKQHEMKFGYNDPDPQNIYRTGWQVWLPFLEMHYGDRLFLAFTTLSLILTSFFGKRKSTNQLIGLWVIPALGYLIYFVAVKSYQYLLPPMIPFLAASMNLPIWLSETRKKHPRLFLVMEGLILLGVALQWIDWLKFDWFLYHNEF